MSKQTFDIDSTNLKSGLCFYYNLVINIWHMVPLMHHRMIGGILRSLATHT